MARSFFCLRATWNLSCGNLRPGIAGTLNFPDNVESSPSGARSKCPFKDSLEDAVKVVIKTNESALKIKA
jgi:hypothetical protein